MARTRLWSAIVAACVGFVVGCGSPQDAPPAKPPAKAVELAAPPSLRGRSVDDDGRPCAGAVLRATRVEPFADAREAVETRADDAGDYAFARLADGEWDLRCSWDGADDVFVATVRVPSVDRLDFRVPEGATITGTLVDGDTNAPIVGATLRWGASVPAATTTSGAGGRFAFRTHRSACEILHVEVERSGVPRQLIRVELGDSTLDGCRIDVPLLASSGAELKGTVTGPGGPVTGAVVAVWIRQPPELGWDWTAAFTTRTAADGRYRFEQVSVPGPDGLGAPIVVVEAPGLAQSGAGQDPSRGFEDSAELMQVVIPETGTVVRDFALRPLRTCTVKGRVVDQDGEPVAGATVEGGAWGNRVETKSGADGAFVLEGTPVDENDDRAKLRVVRGSASTTTSLRVSDDRADEAVVALAIDRRRLVHGRITAPSGAPVGGARIVVTRDERNPPPTKEILFDFVQRRFRPAPETLDAVAGADGFYALDVPAYCTAFKAVAPGFAPTYVEIDETKKDAADVSLDVTLALGRAVSGRVVKRGTTEPVAGVYVAALDDVDDRYNWSGDSALGGEAHVRTDADGRFRVEHCPQEKCDVAVWGDGWLPAVEKHATVGGPETVIEIEPALTIAGRVLFDDGAPVAGVDVSILHGGGDRLRVRHDSEAAHAVTRADGSFVLRRLSAGPWTVFAKGDRCGVAMETTKTERVSGGERELNFVVARRRTIVGRVVDSEGRPIASRPRAYAVPDDDARPTEEIACADDGSFALTCLDDGEYVVRAEATGFLAAEARGVKGGGAPTVFRLSTGLTIDGRLADPAGRPGGGCTVRVDPLPGEAVDLGVFARSDADGRFRISGLVAGPHKLLPSYERHFEIVIPEDFVVEAGAKDVVVRCVAK